MHIYCPRCVASLEEVTAVEFEHGSCRGCNGQLLDGHLRPTGGPDGIVALTFGTANGFAIPQSPLYQTTWMAEPNDGGATITFDQQKVTAGLERLGIEPEVDFGADENTGEMVSSAESDLPAFPDFEWTDGGPPEGGERSQQSEDIDGAESDKEPDADGESSDGEASVKETSSIGEEQPGGSVLGRIESSRVAAEVDSTGDEQAGSVSPPALPELPEFDRAEAETTAARVDVELEDADSDEPSGGMSGGVLGVLIVVVAMAICVGLLGNQSAVADVLLGAEVVLPNPKEEALGSLEAGLQQVASGHPEDAVASFEDALRAQPGLARAHRALAVALVRLKRAGQAVEHYRAYLKFAPEAEDADRVRALLFAYDQSLESRVEAPVEPRP